MKRTVGLFGVCCLLAAWSLSAVAQGNHRAALRWGITAGINGFDAGILELSRGRGLHSFNFAGRVELSFTDAPSRMYLDAELGLSDLAWKFDEPGGEPRRVTSRNYYLHLPLHIGYHGDIERVCAIFADFGPYFAYGLFGESVYRAPAEHTRIQWSSFDETDRFDWGLGVRLGVEVLDHFRLGAAYDYGVRVITCYYSEMHNGNLTLFVGYTF